MKIVYLLSVSKSYWLLFSTGHLWRGRDKIRRLNRLLMEGVMLFLSLLCSPKL